MLVLVLPLFLPLLPLEVFPLDPFLPLPFVMAFPLVLPLLMPLDLPLYDEVEVVGRSVHLDAVVE